MHLATDWMRLGTLAEQAAARSGAAANRARANIDKLDVVLVENEATDGDIGRHPGLAGEAELGREVETVGDPLLTHRAWSARVPSLDHHESTRRALRPAATRVGERDPGTKRGAQHGLTRPALDEPLIRKDVDVRHGSLHEPKLCSARRRDATPATRSDRVAICVGVAPLDRQKSSIGSRPWLLCNADVLQAVVVVVTRCVRRVRCVQRRRCGRFRGDE